MDASELQDLWAAMWGESLVDSFKRLMEGPRVQDQVAFETLTDAARVELADLLLRQCSPRMGSYSSNGDPYWFLWSFGMDIGWRRGIYDDRRLHPIKSAILMLAHGPPRHFGFKTGNEYQHIFKHAAAPATLYLVSQLEYAFRARSRYLGVDGRCIREVPPELRQRVGLGTRRWRRVDPQGEERRLRINQINQAFLDVDLPRSQPHRRPPPQAAG